MQLHHVSWLRLWDMLRFPAIVEASIEQYEIQKEFKAFIAVGDSAPGAVVVGIAIAIVAAVTLGLTRIEGGQNLQQVRIYD
jgi:hypothetical protein